MGFEDIVFEEEEEEDDDEAGLQWIHFR